jgi:hypothetical protein
MRKEVRGRFCFYLGEGLVQITEPGLSGRISYYPTLKILHG